MAPSNIKQVHPSTETPAQSIEEILRTIELMKEEAARKIAEANKLAEAHAAEFADKKSSVRQTAVDAVKAYRTLASPEEFSQFRRDLGMGRKGGSRKSVACSECGKSRHGSKSTCSKAKK